MDALLQLPGVIFVPLFALCADEKRPAAHCELLVAPGLGWAVATQLDDGGPGLVVYHQALAVAVCQRYAIEPARLVLFTRYTDHNSYENLYALHFASGGRDLFNEVSFGGGWRSAVAGIDAPGLVQRLLTGEPLGAEWRTLQPAGPERAGSW